MTTGFARGLTAGESGKQCASINRRDSRVSLACLPTFEQKLLAPLPYGVHPNRRFPSLSLSLPLCQHPSLQFSCVNFVILSFVFLILFFYASSFPSLTDGKWTIHVAAWSREMFTTKKNEFYKLEFSTRAKILWKKARSFYESVVNSALISHPSSYDCSLSNLVDLHVFRNRLSMEENP